MGLVNNETTGKMRRRGFWDHSSSPFTESTVRTDDLSVSLLPKSAVPRRAAIDLLD